MRISRIQIHNFRNFRNLDVVLGEHAVIVGENKIGKSNLLHALRLLLDPSLPDSARQLREEDFWDGLSRLSREDVIRISVDLAGFEDDEDLYAVLGDYLVETEPLTARLTYLFRPLPHLKEAPKRNSDYEFIIFGGDSPDKRVGNEVRRRLPLELLPALRDAESDLANWRRSPLKPLLDKVAATIERETLEDIADSITEAANKIRDNDNISALDSTVSERLKEMVGTHAVDVSVRLLPTDPDRLIRSLRLFIDGGRRGIGEASLGTANLLYLTLKSLELDQLMTEDDRDHTFLAIEEPEAHLHPHVQRLVFRDFLRPRGHQVGQAPVKAGQTILLTTHSPHIVSVAPINSIVLLRKTEDKAATEGVSTAELNLTEAELADLERYIDVTRGELLFSKGVILVEGDAEEYLVPVLAKKLGYDFDQLGISVCSIAGTNFEPYVKLLGNKGLKIPFAVLTDMDPQDDGTNLGEPRVLSLLAHLMPPETYNCLDRTQLLSQARAYGIFLNEHTLEVDLFRAGRRASMCDALIELADNKAAKRRAERWKVDKDSLDVTQFLKDINAIGKGRFAQRVASNILAKPGKACPSYIKEAIEYVASKCR